MRFVLVGSGAPAQKGLELLLAEGRAEVAAVFTGERDAQIRSICENHAVKVHDAARLRDAAGAPLVRGQNPDWLLSANSTFLLSRDLLGAPARGALNLHPGLLPGYAGLHTHQWALRNGETEFGVTIHHMEPAVDAGSIVACRRFPIRPDDTGLSLFTRCLSEGTKLLVEVLDLLLSGEALPAIPQDLSRRRLYRHRDALDARVDWRWTAAEIARFVRAGNYEPFTSPTYTAALDPAPGFDPAPELLRAAETPCPAPPPEPGAIAGWVDDHPIVACRAGAVALTRARLLGDVLTRARWREYLDALPDPGRLRGRRPD